MSERRPLGKIRMTPLNAGADTPAPAEPGRHRRPPAQDAHRIPHPRKPEPDETP
jgi:hypothetical protein